MKHQTVQPSIDKHRGTISHQMNITKQQFSQNAQCHKDYFPSVCVQSYAQSVVRVILLTRFCQVFTTVAILYGGGGAQWHDAAGMCIFIFNKY